MRLLIITQTVDLDHPALGFFHRWVEEFARHCESVLVICLREGRHELPENVRVLSLGKDAGASRFTYVRRFYHSIYAYRHQYDAVFVHMNPEYVCLGGLFWRQWGKKIALWYVHKSVTLRLRVAAWLADAVCTASPQSIRLRSSKIRAMGHGIDTGLFRPAVHERTGMLRVITVGRIALSKGLLETLRALDVLAARGTRFSWTVAGAPGTAAETRYADMLRRQIAERSYAADVDVRGPVPHDKLPEIFAQAGVLVNISATGGFDKVVLEALASGVPAVSSSAPFRKLLSPYGLFIDTPAPEKIADAIVRARGTDAVPLSEEVEAHHSLSALVPRILALLSP